MKKLPFIIALILFISCNAEKEVKNPSYVEIKQNEEGNYRFYIDGKETYILGAGCEGGDVAALAANGGNAFRTWMDQEIRPSELSVLEDAEKNNVKVLMGLAIGRERHGYNYNDTAWVAQQKDSVLAKVIKYKDHPALLGWIIGNEVNLGTSNMKIFDAINDISKSIHKIDGNHPTTFTLAGIGKKEVDYIKQHCNDIDFISIQMYADIANLQKRINDAGWEGPYLVTEWGATGHWEVARTEWDVAIEQTSKEKAEAFMMRYKMAIEADQKNCMGSFVFLWGQKQERTPTWYGMFLENGSKTETVDAMSKIWTGQYPNDRCPALDSFLLNGKTAYENIYLKASEKFMAEVFYTNHDNDSLSFLWEIIPETTNHSYGGDFEERPKTIYKEKMDSNVELNAPNKPGAYRLFIYIFDNNSNAATANIPFYVKE